MEQTKESKRIIGGKMYVINIKSRYEQTPQKYVKLFEQLYAKDRKPPIKYPLSLYL